MGCCVFAIMLAGAPRLAFLIWWLFDSARIQLTFGNFLWPLLGLLFLPWTTLMYVFVFPGGINWFDWLWLAIALAIDLSTYVGNDRARRMRYSS